jgi:hypothetical protein
MFDFLLRPLRSAVRGAEHDMTAPVEETQHEIIDAVSAIEHATGSIERHVEVVEVLATSVGPLTQSVDQLNATLKELVAMLAPMAKVESEAAYVERDVERAESFFRLRHHREPDAEDAPAGGQPPTS